MFLFIRRSDHFSLAQPLKLSVPLRPLRQVEGFNLHKLNCLTLLRETKSKWYKERKQLRPGLHEQVLELGHQRTKLPSPLAVISAPWGLLALLVLLFTKKESSVKQLLLPLSYSVSQHCTEMNHFFLQTLFLPGFHSKLSLFQFSLTFWHLLSHPLPKLLL